MNHWSPLPNAWHYGGKFIAGSWCQKRFETCGPHATRPRPALRISGLTKSSNRTRRLVDSPKTGDHVLFEETSRASYGTFQSVPCSPASIKAESSAFIPSTRPQHNSTHFQPRSTPSNLPKNHRESNLWADTYLKIAQLTDRWLTVDVSINQCTQGRVVSCHGDIHVVCWNPSVNSMFGVTALHH